MPDSSRFPFGPWLVLVLTGVSLVWLVLGQVASAMVKVLAVGVLALREPPRWFGVLDGVVSWFVLVLLLRWLVFRTDAAALVCGTFAVLAYLALAPLIERGDPDDD